MKRRAIALLLLLALLPLSGASAKTWYVYTENGLTLNLRSEVNNAVIEHIPYGTALVPDEDKSTELAAYVTYNGKSGYVRWTFLVDSPPPPKKKGAAAATPTLSPTPAPAALPDYSGFRPYVCDAVIPRGEGETLLRWAPDERAPVAFTYSGAFAWPLLQLSSDGRWCQVYDEGNGVCGFLPADSLLLIE